MGMMLYAEGMIVDYEVIHCQNFQKNGTVIEFPVDALSRPIEFAHATFHHHLFQFPEEVTPVSPIVWLHCFSQDSVFKEPAAITLPHCVDCTAEDSTKSLFFLKADHDNKTVDSDGNMLFSFEKIHNKQFFSPKNRIGTIEDNHFCFFCIGIRLEKEIIGRVLYSITIVKPKSYERSKRKEIFCIFHYDLDTCKSVSLFQSITIYYAMTIIIMYTNHVAN